MNELTGLYWARALKIVRQFEAGEINFADLTGLGEAFAASLAQDLQKLPETTRPACCDALDARLKTAASTYDASSLASTALSELQLSISRTSIC